MSRLRKLCAALTPVIVMIGGCLVFDGRVANKSGEAGVDASTSEGGRGNVDGASDRAAKADGQAEDVAQVDGNTGHKDGSTNGVICNVDAASGPVVYCAGGKSAKCCAHLDIEMGSVWTYPPAQCLADCMEAGAGGFYDYECDEDSQCSGGMICCGLDEGSGTPPPLTTSTCMNATTCHNQGGIELCQLPSKRCAAGTSCQRADPAYLPPGYYYCK
jgi:hypothetical protein